MTATNQEKADYIARIDSKAKVDNISIKHAARKLGLKDWRYWVYKNDLKASEYPAAAGSRTSVPPTQEDKPVNISFSVAPDVWAKLEDQAKQYATQPAYIAQIILHDAVRKNGGESTRTTHQTAQLAPN